MRSFLDPPINVNEGTVLLRNIHLVLVRPDRSQRHQFFCKPQSIYKDFWMMEELKEWVCRDEVPGVTLREILEWEGHIEIYRLNNHQVLDFIEDLVKDGQLILYDTHDFNAAEKEEENRQATHSSLPSALGSPDITTATPAIPKPTNSPPPRAINTPDTTAEAQEKLKRDLALDISQMVLDIAGIVDPTPISDGASALIALSRGHWWDAAISAVSIIPYVGDLAKLGKLPGYAKSIEKVTKIAKTDTTWANELQPVLENLKPFLDTVVETGASTLPKSALEAFNGMKKSVDDFLMYNTSSTTATSRSESSTSPLKEAVMDEKAGLDELGRGVKSEASTVITHRAGNRQVDVDGQRWNVPKDTPIDKIPTKDSVGDALQKATREAGESWNPKRNLTRNEQLAINKARKSGEHWRANLLEKQAKGRWAEKQVKKKTEGMGLDVQWSRTGADVTDPKTGIKYDIMSGTKSNMDAHAKRMPDDLFRMITF